MTDMICGRCGRSGIRWIGPFGELTHTECPHCGGTNCQTEGDQEEECVECGDPDCNGECYGDDLMGASS